MNATNSRKKQSTKRLEKRLYIIILQSIELKKEN